MGERTTTTSPARFDASSPFDSQGIQRSNAVPDCRDHLRAALAQRVAANRARHRAVFAKSTARLVAMLLLVVIAALAVVALRQTDARRWIPWVYAILGVSALVLRGRDALAARRHSRTRRATLLVNELDVSVCLGDLDAFERAATELRAIDPTASLPHGALAFAAAARGRAPQARALLEAARSDEDRWAALARLVLAALDGHDIPRCAARVEPLVRGQPLVVQQLVLALSRGAQAPFRAPHPPSASSEALARWMATFVPAIAGDVLRAQAPCWFEAPRTTTAAALPPLAATEPPAVRLLSATAWSGYAIALAVIVAAVVGDSTQPRIARGHAVAALLAMAAVGGVAAVFRNAQLRALEHTCTAKADTRGSAVTDWLATHAWMPFERWTAMACIASRSLLAHRHDAAIRQARALAVATHAVDGSADPFFRQLPLWIVGLTGDVAATESLLAAMEQQSPTDPNRIGRRFDARLALAVAQQDVDALEQIVQSAPDAALDDSIAAWVVAQLQRETHRDTPHLVGDALVRIGLAPVLHRLLRRGSTP